MDSGKGAHPADVQYGRRAWLVGLEVSRQGRLEWRQGKVVVVKVRDSTGRVPCQERPAHSQCLCMGAGRGYMVFAHEV